MNPEPGSRYPTRNKNMPEAPGTEGGNEPMGKIKAKNLEELRKVNPELAAKIESEVKAAILQKSIDEAVAEERKRIQEIDEIADAINDNELVREAKYGEKACTAQELALIAACNKTVDRGVEAAKKAYSK